MKSTGIRTALTILLACAAAPALGMYILAILTGHGGTDFWFTQSGMIPAWLFAIPFVLPFTLPAAIILCLGSAWFSRRQWKLNPNRIISFITLGLVSSLPYPLFMTIISLRSTFDATGYGVTRHDQILFIVQHWVAAGSTGILGGILLSVIWRTNEMKKDANQRLEATPSSSGTYN